MILYKNNTSNAYVKRPFSKCYQLHTVCHIGHHSSSFHSKTSPCFPLYSTKIKLSTHSIFHLYLHNMGRNVSLKSWQLSQNKQDVIPATPQLILKIFRSIFSVLVINNTFVFVFLSPMCRNRDMYKFEVLMYK